MIWKPASLAIQSLLLLHTFWVTTYLPLVLLCLLFFHAFHQKPYKMPTVGHEVNDKIMFNCTKDIFTRKTLLSCQQKNSSWLATGDSNTVAFACISTAIYRDIFSATLRLNPSTRFIQNSDQNSDFLWNLSYRNMLDMLDTPNGHCGKITIELH